RAWKFSNCRATSRGNIRVESQAMSCWPTTPDACGTQAFIQAAGNSAAKFQMPSHAGRALMPADENEIQRTAMAAPHGSQVRWVQLDAALTGDCDSSVATHLGGRFTPAGFFHQSCWEQLSDEWRLQRPGFLVGLCR